MTLSSTLDQLLSETRAEAIERERTTFDEAVAPFGERLVLFGAGKLGRKTVVGLRQIGREPLAFIDNDQRLWNKRVDGVPVLAPEEAARKYSTEAAFIVTIWRGEGAERMRDRVDQLRSLECRTIAPFLPLFWKYADTFLPHYAVDLPHRALAQAGRVRSAFQLMSEEESRREFVAGIRWRVRGDFDSFGEPVATEIYFPDDLFEISASEVFIDCGAFDGDTVRRFLTHAPRFRGEVKAFEPDPANCARLQRYVDGLPEDLRRKITVFPYAVGRMRETVRFDGTGTEAAAVGSGSLEVESVSLDTALEGSTPTYIKMDTEGSELEALEGARRTILKHKPRLAICVYHKQNHLWEIPLLIKDASAGYHFFLRPQLLEGWDLVCYAVATESAAT